MLPLGMLVLLAAPASAAGCPGHPDAIGTSRVLIVDPTEHARLGTMQYHFTLPLAEKEVVLTFDDGPLPPYSNHILDILAANCVKATYFIVGRMAEAYPAVVRRIRAAGHTIGTHSQNHPRSFHFMGAERVKQEVEQGIASTAAALGDSKDVAPFFRIPGLARGPVVEKFLAEQQLMTWSADFPADDWRHISASEVMRRALRRLEAKGKGILLLHDIQPATVIALPGLLKELKERGFRIVHVVPAAPGRPKTATRPWQWVLKVKPSDIWPEPPIFAGAVDLSLPAPGPKSFGIDLASGTPAALRPMFRYLRTQAQRPRKPVRLVSPWPRLADAPYEMAASILPAPDAGNFRQPVVVPALPVLPASPTKITGLSRGAATMARYRAGRSRDVPVVPIVSREATLPVVPVVHRAPASDDAAATPARLRHGARSGQWPVPAVLQPEPPPQP